MLDATSFQKTKTPMLAANTFSRRDDLSKKRTCEDQGAKQTKSQFKSLIFTAKTVLDG
jgi:hypothetical protein